MSHPVNVDDYVTSLALDSIHPFPLIQFRIAEGLKPVPAVTEQEAGYTLDRTPATAGLENDN